MCLALCLGVVCFALAGNAWAGTTRLATGVTVPSTYAQETTITPNRLAIFGGTAQYGNTYKLVNNATYSSDIYRDMGVAPWANFYVVVELPANVYFQGPSVLYQYNCPLAGGCRLPASGDVTVSGGGGGATFSLVAGGVNGTNFVTYLATITTAFTSAPTLAITSGTNGWAVRDYSNKLAAAGSAGAISASVMTYDAATTNLFDSGNDAVAIMQSSPAVQITSALYPTTAVINSSDLRMTFTPTFPDTPYQDNGASVGVGLASPVPLNTLGTLFTLSTGDKFTFAFTSSNNDFSGLVMAPIGSEFPGTPGTIPGITWAGIPAIYSTGNTKTITVAGNNAAIGFAAQPFVFTVDGGTTLVPRTFSVKIDLTLVAGGATSGGGAKALQAATPVTQWMFGPGEGEMVLLANWLNGNTTQYNSRIYLFNSTSTPTDITARVLKMPPAGGTPTSAEITAPGSPIALGTLSGYSGMNIKLKEDILNYLLAALPGGALPYTENGGNLIVEITAHGLDRGISGTCQVFSGTFAFGQVPLVVISSGSD